jgi:hypothetical protein
MKPAFKLDATGLIAENVTRMPRSVTIMVCAFVALVVMWVCIHPGLDLAPTAFRFTAFVAAFMLLLRFSFRFTGISVFVLTGPGARFGFPDLPEPEAQSLVLPLRC